METIVRILKEAGTLKPGFHIHIDNPPWMPLDIEDIQQNGPNGLPSLSVAHYGEQNGDLMRDPEMCFELTNPLGTSWTMTPYYFRNDYLGVEQLSRTRDEKNYIFYPNLFHQHECFVCTWDRNLRAQGFLEAFQRSR